jgi:hypothetical protein
VPLRHTMLGNSRAQVQAGVIGREMDAHGRKYKRRRVARERPMR